MEESKVPAVPETFPLPGACFQLPGPSTSKVPSVSGSVVDCKKAPASVSHDRFKRWESFNDEVTQSVAGLAAQNRNWMDPLQMMLKVSSLTNRKAEQESDIDMSLLSRWLCTVAEMLGCGCLSQFPQGENGGVDFMFVSNDAPVLPVEDKWVTRLLNLDKLRGCYKSSGELRRIPNYVLKLSEIELYEGLDVLDASAYRDDFRYCVEQAVGYMHKWKTTYAVLTCYASWTFFKKSGEDILVSRPLKAFSEQPTVLACLVGILRLAIPLRGSAGPRDLEDRVDDDFLRCCFNQGFQLLDVHPGALGAVEMAHQVYGHVFVKAARHGSGDASSIAREKGIYSQLSALQGKFIPSVVPVEFSPQFVTLVTKAAPLERDMPFNRSGVLAAVDAVHRCGFALGEARTSNFIAAGESAFVLDFHLAHRATSEELKAERTSFEALL